MTDRDLILERLSSKYDLPILHLGMNFTEIISKLGKPVEVYPSKDEYDSESDFNSTYFIYKYDSINIAIEFGVDINNPLDTDLFSRIVKSISYDITSEYSCAESDLKTFIDSLNIKPIETGTVPYGNDKEAYWKYYSAGLELSYDKKTNTLIGVAVRDPKADQ